METYDVVIIGGGSGGIAAARILAQQGKKTALIEKKKLGGVCLNCGCVPTKMLLGATAPKGLLQGQIRQGVASGEIHVNYASLQKRINRFIDASVRTITTSLQSLGVELIEGRGVCVDSNNVQVFDKNGKLTNELHTDYIIFSGGSKSAAYPGLVPDHVNLLDSTDMLQLSEIPKSLTIIGAGAIGLELGDFFHSMGAEVTIIEAASHIAPTEDEDIAAELQKRLSKTGINFIVGTKASSLNSHKGMAVLTLEDGRELVSEKALIAVGRTPLTADLNAEKIGCKINKRGFIQVDKGLKATSNVYAIGDINGLALLAHAAEHQGAWVARNILEQNNAPYSPSPMPSCIYGRMEVMRVGKSAQDIIQETGNATVSRSQLVSNIIAQSGGDPSGFVKVVWKNDQPVGIAAIGHGVSHLVTAAQLLLMGQYYGAKLEEIIFSHPTLDESLRAAIRATKEIIT